MAFRRLATVLAASLTVASCGPTMIVSSHVDRNIDFSRYRTFDWGPADALPTGDARLDQNAFFKDQVQGAVEKQLAMRGLQLIAAGAPDLLIHYHANIRQRLDVNRADRSYGYCTAGDCPPDTIVYEAGTLVIDIMDARSKRLVWRGWAQESVEDLLDNPEQMARMLREAVERMMQRLPRML
jgi:hypothetical protein